MIDFSGFKEFERTSRESFIQLWQHAHRIKGSIEVTFYAYDTGEQIELVAHDGKFEIYGFPPFDPESGGYNCRLVLKVKPGLQLYPFEFEFTVIEDRLSLVEYGEVSISAVHFFRIVAQSFPGAVLEDEGATL